MHCLKFGRVSRQLFYTAIVFVLLSPAVLFSQDLGIPAGDIQRPAKGIWLPPTPPMGPVIVAAGRLGLQTELTEANVKVENWPTSIIPPDAVTSLEEIVDMVTKTRLRQGMPIVKGSIQHKNYNSFPVIPPSMKVVAVRVAASDAIESLLNPGSKVDVIGVIKRLDPSTNQTKNYSRTFLKALQVYSIGNRTRIDKIAKSGNSHASSIVGLLVTEKQSEALVFVQNNGSLKLVLRGDDVENDGGVGPFEEIRKALSKEDFKAYEEIRNLRALINDQEQVLQQFQKRLERLESLEQVKPSK